MLGLQCTESAIRAAAAKRSGQLLSVHARAEQQLEKDVITAGDVVDPEKVLEALSKLKASTKGAGNGVTLCLSPRVVYTHLLRIPKVRSGRLAAAIRGELEAVLPDDVGVMTLRFTPVSRERGSMRIGVTAVRADVLTDYQSVLKKAGFSLKHVTTTAMALGDTVKHTDTFVVVNAEDPEPSIVIFYNGLPVDEQLLPSVAAQNVLKAVKDLLQEYRNDGIHIQHVAVHGTTELFEKITAGLKPAKAAKDKKEEIADAITTEHLLANLKKNDLPWGGVIVSSLGRGLDVRSGKRPVSMHIVLVLLFTLAAGYFVWTVGSAQLLGIWREILGMMS